MASFAQLIRDTAKTLEHAGTDAPRREARLLVALAAGLDTAMLIAREPDEVVDGAVLERLSRFVARRAAGEPFAHICGHCAFYGLEFICDARALVPRADSETVVETALKLLPLGRGVKLADLGTGSGCLLIAILKTRCGLEGLGIEADPQAASLARENVKRHQIGARAEILNLHWQDWCDWGEVDMIISNPPYIQSAVIDTLAPEVRVHDPLQALDGGRDGLAAYRSILGHAGQKMRTGARLVFEIGYDQDAAVRALMAEAGFTQIASARDLGGNDRVVSGRCPQN